jgi:hypothetical protein
MKPFSSTRGTVMMVWVSAVIVVMLVLTSADIGLTPRVAEAQSSPKYMGVVSCGASNCHGSTKPKSDYPKLNENIVWRTKGRHYKAYESLTSEKLKSGVRPSRIAKALKIDRPEASERCLTCHNGGVKPDQRGPKFDVADGVHCEACHGPAEKWLESHAAKNTHEQSVKLGMYDTRNLLLRAEKCVSCHLQIDADLVSAGHLDLLAFELDTFSIQSPPHWRDEGPWFGPRAWATGQVISLREAAKQLENRAKGNASAKLVQEAAARLRGHGIMVRQIFSVLVPEATKDLSTDLAAVADTAGKGDRAGAGMAAGRLIAQMNQHAPRIAGRELDQATTKKLMMAVSGDTEAAAAAGLRGAEQVAMGLDRLYSAYSSAPGQRPSKPVTDAVGRFFDVLDKYDSAKFTAAMKTFRQAIE